MSRTFASVLDSASRGFVYLLLFLLPLFVLPWSLDPLETGKQTLLVLLSAAAFLCWVGSMVARRRYEVRAGWLVVLPLGILASSVFSALRSSSPYLSWIGTNGQEYLSALTTFSLTLLYFVIVNRMTTEREHRAAHGILLASAAIAGAVGISSVFSGSTANTVGTLNALGVYLAGICTFGCGLLVASRPDHSLFHAGRLGLAERLAVFLVAAETLVFLMALDYAVLWMVLLAGLSLLCFVALLRAGHLHDQRRWILPFLLVIASLSFCLWLPSPFRASLPSEVTPSVSASLEMARQTLSSPSGLLGSGPGTFAFDYALHHDAAVNATPFWSQRFDRASSFFLTVAPGFGMLGLFAWGAFIAAFFVRGCVRVLLARAYADWAAVLVDLAGWSAFVAAAFLYPGNMTTVFFLFVLAALLASQVVSKTSSSTFDAAPRAGSFFAASVVLSSLGVLTALFVGSLRLVSELALSRAVQLSAQRADTGLVLESLGRAVRFNRFNDAAKRDLSQVLLLRAGEEVRDLRDVSAVAPETRQYIQALAAASVDAAVSATDLSPRDAVNWLSRAMVYRELIPLISNAGDAAVSAHEQAIALEPLNPSDRVELGKTYLALADALSEAAASDDETLASDAKQKRAVHLAAAESAFQKAVDLKPDYAPAHFQMAVAYEQGGRVDEAIEKMARVEAYNPADVGVTFELGVLYLRRGKENDLARAKAQFERVVLLVPTYANARWLLASVYEREGNAAAAIEQVEKVLEYNPDNDTVKQRLSRLRSGTAAEEIPYVIVE